MMRVNKYVFISKLEDGFALGLWVFIKPWCICLYLGRWVINIHGGKEV